MVALRWAFQEGHVALRAHAHVEMLIDRITLNDVLRAGAGSDLLEDYRDRPQGHTLLLLGYVRPEKPIHLVVNVEAFEADWSDPVVLVTVYEPEPPEWMDERTRGRKVR